ncbi:hypothetical protein BDV95DRAFT_601718 [Massariosphaeria phaeospora]|uniref:CRIB domain-containing protein n=1 Tax=Massariosphaeria phaeospora TaxID=100035 RepID=A0A7C8IPP4_9PLEO|nr:hypothetical protein BDV95DRAFT_601718 [Massariosphaeria phaeospora]
MSHSPHSKARAHIEISHDSATKRRCGSSGGHGTHECRTTSLPPGADRAVSGSKSQPPRAYEIDLRKANRLQTIQGALIKAEFVELTFSDSSRTRIERQAKHIQHRDASLEHSGTVEASSPAAQHSPVHCRSSAQLSMTRGQIDQVSLARRDGQQEVQPYSRTEHRHALTFCCRLMLRRNLPMPRSSIAASASDVSRAFRFLFIDVPPDINPSNTTRPCELSGDASDDGDKRGLDRSTKIMLIANDKNEIDSGVAEFPHIGHIGWSDSNVDKSIIPSQISGKIANSKFRDPQNSSKSKIETRANLLRANRKRIDPVLRLIAVVLKANDLLQSSSSGHNDLEI